MDFPVLHRLRCRSLLVSLSFVVTTSLAPMGVAQTAAFTQSLAATASSDAAIADWYRTTSYETPWTGAEGSEPPPALSARMSPARFRRGGGQSMPGAGKPEATELKVRKPGGHGSH